jgi:predicted GTPase
MLYKQLREYEDKFAEYLRMSAKTFDLLLNKIEDKIQKQDTNYRVCISTEERLVTLR